MLGVVFIINIELLKNSNINLYDSFIIDRMTFQSEEVLAYGAKYENIPCGAIFARLKQGETETKCKITSFFVLKLFRRKGIGTALLNAIKNKLKVILC